MSMTSEPLTSTTSTPAPSASTGSPRTSPQASARGKSRRTRRVLASELTADTSPVLAGVYIRVSTFREEMISPELQQRDVDAFLNRKIAETQRSWKAVVVEQDLDISGRSFAREGIQRLLAMVREGTITTILTYRYDRFGRNLRQALDHLRRSRRWVGRSSASPNRSTPPPPSASSCGPTA